MMNCEKVREWLLRDLNGVAEPSAEVAAHLERCSECAAEAGRMKGLAEAARAALPEADVPVGFTERVLDAVSPATGQRALLDAARPRAMRWAVAASILVALSSAYWLGGQSARDAGDPHVLQPDGRWEETSSIPAGALLGVAPGRTVTFGAIEAKALRLSVFRNSQPPELLAGEIVVRSPTPGELLTPFGALRWNGRSECVATLTPKETKDMLTFDTLRKSVPAAMMVTVLSGSAQLAYADGGTPAEGKPGQPIRAGVIIKSEPKLTMRYDDADLAEVLQSVADSAQRKLIFRTKFNSRINVALTAVRWEGALNLLTEPNELTWSLDSNGAIVISRARAAKADQMLIDAQNSKTALEVLRLFYGRAGNVLLQHDGQKRDAFQAVQAKFDAEIDRANQEKVHLRHKYLEAMQQLKEAEKTLNAGQRGNGTAMLKARIAEQHAEITAFEALAADTKMALERAKRDIDVLRMAGVQDEWTIVLSTVQTQLASITKGAKTAYGRGDNQEGVRLEKEASMLQRAAKAMYEARDAEKMVTQMARSRRFGEIRRAAEAADDLHAKAEAYFKDLERSQRRK
ncbi:MAG: hypothetical protein V3T86_15010 [Planctomycetota bacterium]